MELLLSMTWLEGRAQNIYLDLDQTLLRNPEKSTRYDIVGMSVCWTSVTFLPFPPPRMVIWPAYCPCPEYLREEKQWWSFPSIILQPSPQLNYLSFVLCIRINILVGYICFVTIKVIVESRADTEYWLSFLNIGFLGIYWITWPIFYYLTFYDP